MNSCQKYFSACVLALLTQAAFAQSAPQLGSAASFAVLSAAANGGGAVTCTDSTISGDVGSSGQPASVVRTSCAISGAVVAPVSAAGGTPTSTARTRRSRSTPCDPDLDTRLTAETLLARCLLFRCGGDVHGQRADARRILERPGSSRSGPTAPAPSRAPTSRWSWKAAGRRATCTGGSTRPRR